METTLNTSQPNFESVWAILQENAIQLKELRKSQKETDQFLKEKFAETDRMMKETDRRIGTWANNHGQFAEEYFINAFEKGQTNFFGEKFDRIQKRWRKNEDEYDIVLINGKTVGIIEVKFKAHENDIPSVLYKAETFRVNFPEYKDFRIYLGLASLSFYEDLENACIELGIAVIKQVGDMVVINDSNLKVY